MTILERFQSTPPVWEATTYVSQLGTLQTSVSIHDSRVGGDAQDKPSNTITASFKPRLPCGRRQYSGFISEAYNAVSIHASRVGGDRIASALSCISRQFQSTPPVWEATNWSDADELGNVVSIHASRVGGDSMALYRWARMTCFNPRLPCGRRLPATGYWTGKAGFQSTPPVWEATAISGVSEGAAARYWPCIEK